MHVIGAGYVAKFVDAGVLDRVQAPKSEAHAEAGNYRKAHIRAFGLDIAIENPKGTIRRKLTPDGEEKWRVKMPAHYGYLKGTKGADKDAVDCYIGPDKDAKLVWIVDQIHPSDGSFDEHKCLLGFRSYEDAVKAYEAGFSDGSGAKRKGAVVEMDLAEFKDWLKGDCSKPLAYDGKLAKAWSEAKVVRDQVGRFAFKNGGRTAAIGVGIAAAGLGLGALAAKFLKPGNESKPIINETALWAEHNLRRAATQERIGNHEQAKAIREATRMAEDEPMPVSQKSLGDKARLPHAMAAKPAAQAIGALLTGDNGAKWEKRSDGLILGSSGPDGVAARSVYQDRSGELIARIDLAIRHNDGVGGAREGLKQEVAAYKALGVDRVALHANIEIGAYAWARMGFVPGQKSWDVLRKKLSGKVRDARYGKLNKALSSSDPKGIWAVADARLGSVNVGKGLLKDEHWFGSLPLNDAQAMNRFNTYVSQKKG